MSSETRHAHHPLDSKEYVSRLNDDVLSEVFMLNTEVDFDTPHIPSRTIRHISQVSTRWRNITLSSPMIWASSLDFADKTEWIQTVLDRAKDLPLNVVYPSFSSQLLSNKPTISKWRHLEHEDLLALVQKTWHGPINIDKLDMALSLFSRSRRFRLMLYNGYEWKYARQKSIFLAAPHLEELIVVVYALASRPHNGVLPPQPTIFDVGVACKPNLKTLHFSGHGLKPPAFDSHTSLSLTTLVIHGLENDKSLTVKELVAILSLSPHLEVLHLNYSIDLGSPLHLIPGKPISLPRLRSLKLQVFYSFACMLITRIEAPPSCAMDVRFSGAESSTAYTPLVSTTFSLIEQRFQDFLALQPIVDMSLFVKRYPGLGWKFNNNIHSPDETPFCVAWTAFYEMDDDSTPFFLPLKKILDIVSPTLTSLYLDTAKIRRHEPPYQVGLLGAFQNVELLGIQSEYTLKFIEMQFNDNLAASRDTPLFPRLQLILLSYLRIRKNKKLRICNIFARRLESGTPIAKCRVKDCSGPALRELVNDLRVLGVDVEWDEKTEFEKGHYDAHKEVLGPLAIQSTRDGFYIDDSDDFYDSEDLFGSDSDRDEAR